MSSLPNGCAIATAGAIPWRVRSGRLQVAMVHRPRYDDWSWPKGKLDPDEDWPVAAVREVWEETGLRVRLAAPLPCTEFFVSGPRGRALKQVRYWAAEVTGGRGRLRHEVDEVRWADPAAARKLLTRKRDHEQLNALAAAHQTKTLELRPYIVVRHAKALPRRKWSKDDWLRPLDDEGAVQARKLADLLLAFGTVRLLSSSATRCFDTLDPYARSTGLKLRTSHALSEEGFAKRPQQAVNSLEKHLAGRRPGAICSHGPVLPALLTTLAEHARGAQRTALKAAAKDGMEKGEALVAYLDRKDRVAAVERFAPLG